MQVVHQQLPVIRVVGRASLSREGPCSRLVLLPLPTHARQAMVPDRDGLVCGVMREESAPPGASLLQKLEEWAPRGSSSLRWRWRCVLRRPARGRRGCRSLWREGERRERERAERAEREQRESGERERRKRERESAERERTEREREREQSAERVRERERRARAGALSESEKAIHEHRERERAERERTESEREQEGEALHERRGMAREGESVHA